MLRWWDGRRVRRNASSHISLSPGGIIYVGVLLREQLPRDTAYVRVGVDDEDRTLHIAPCEDDTEGHISLIRKPGHRNSCRVHCKVALEWAGVNAKKNTIVPAEFKDGEIVATLPPSLFGETTDVPEFRDWGPLDEDNRPRKDRKGDTYHLWCNQLRGLGYKIESRELRACDYGAPTIRKRLFVIARCDGEPIVWPAPTHGPRGELFGLKPFRTAVECIDWSIPCPSIFERKKPLAEKTMERIARGIRKYVIEAEQPFIVTCNHGGPEFRGQTLCEPFKTLTGARDAHGLCVPTILAIDHKGSGGASIWHADSPARTITQENRFALVAAFLQKYFGGIVGADLREPAPTVTAVDHNSLVTSHLTKFYGTTTGSDVREPVPTVTGAGQHIAEVRAFLCKWYGTAVGQTCRDPMHTVTGRDRLGLVTVEGVDYQIADIGLRMLTPRELARAQGFPDSYILTGSKSNQVSKIGNSVCPQIAKALVTANVQLKQIHAAGIA